MTDRSATQKGLVPYVVHMVRDEGVRSLYKGFVPSLVRSGSWALHHEVASNLMLARIIVTALS